VDSLDGRSVSEVESEKGRTGRLTGIGQRGFRLYQRDDFMGCRITKYGPAKLYQGVRREATDFYGGTL